MSGDVEPILLHCEAHDELVPAGTPFFVSAEGRLVHAANDFLLEISRSVTLGVLSENTLKAYTSDVAGILTRAARCGRSLSTVTPDLLFEVLGVVEDGNRKKILRATATRRLFVLSRLLETALKIGEPVDPAFEAQIRAAMVDKRRSALRIHLGRRDALPRRRVPTDRQASRLLAAFEFDAFRLMASLMKESGLRHAEARTLPLSALEEAVKTPVGWQIAVKGKGDKLRAVTIPSALAKRLRAYCARERTQAIAWAQARDLPAAETLFLHPETGRSFTENQVRYAFALASAKTSVHNTPHDLRRLYATGRATTCIEERRSGLDSLRREMGHASLSTTFEHYVQLPEKHARTQWKVRDLADDG